MDCEGGFMFGIVFGEDVPGVGITAFSGIFVPGRIWPFVVD